MKSRDDRPSIRKLAKAANVSPSTASRALAGREGVSPQTRARLLRMAKEMGLVPTSSAAEPGGADGDKDRGFRRRITATLLIDARANVGLAEFSTEPFFAELIAGLYEGGGRYRVDLQLVRADDDQAVDDAIRRTADALVWLSYDRFEGYQPWLPVLSERDIAVVLCDHYVADLPFDAVLSDNVGGAYQAAQYIAGLGHRRVGIVSQDLSSIAAFERTRGSLAGLVQAGVSPEDILVVSAAPSFEGGYQVLDPMLDFGATAVLCGNDTMALGVIRRAAQRGVAVPDELSVVGFDDISTSSKVTPALTTVRVDRRLLGLETIRRLRFVIAEREMGIRLPGSLAGIPVRTLIPTRLVCRESTGAAVVRVPR